MTEVERGRGGIDTDINAYPLAPQEFADLIICAVLIDEDISNRAGAGCPQERSTYPAMSLTYPRSLKLSQICFSSPFCIFSALESQASCAWRCFSSVLRCMGRRCWRVAVIDLRRHDRQSDSRAGLETGRKICVDMAMKILKILVIITIIRQ